MPEPVTNAELNILWHKECEGPDCINNRLIVAYRKQRDALVPFAEMAVCLDAVREADEQSPLKDSFPVLATRIPGGQNVLTVGDLRAALAALEPSND